MIICSVVFLTNNIKWMQPGSVCTCQLEESAMEITPSEIKFVTDFSRDAASICFDTFMPHESTANLLLHKLDSNC